MYFETEWDINLNFVHTHNVTYSVAWKKRIQNSFRNFWTVGWIFSQFKKIDIILILFCRINDICILRRYETFFCWIMTLLNVIWPTLHIYETSNDRKLIIPNVIFSNGFLAERHFSEQALSRMPNHRSHYVILLRLYNYSGIIRRKFSGRMLIL